MHGKSSRRAEVTIYSAHLLDLPSNPKKRKGLRIRNTMQFIGYSPLSYPGSKRKIRREVVGILKKFGAETLGLCAPFMGGASVELQAAAEGIDVHASDAFRPLTEFWEVLMDTPHALARRIYDILTGIGYRLHKDGEHHPDTKRRLGHIARLCFTSQTRLDRAAYFYIRNKTCYGGMMFKATDPDRHIYDGYGVLRADGKRDISIESLQRLHNFETRIHIACCDYREALRAHPFKIVYCDPPYMEVNELLYGCSGNMQKGFDHDAFYREITRMQTDWVISYDNHPKVREMYKDYYITTRNWTYQLTKERHSERPRELIICSDDPH